MRHRRRVAIKSVQELEYEAKVYFDKAEEALGTAEDLVGYLDQDFEEDPENLPQDPDAIGELRETAEEIVSYLLKAQRHSIGGNAALKAARMMDESAYPQEHSAPRPRRRR